MWSEKCRARMKDVAAWKYELTDSPSCFIRFKDRTERFTFKTSRLSVHFHQNNLSKCDFGVSPILMDISICTWLWAAGQSTQTYTCACTGFVICRSTVTFLVFCCCSVAVWLLRCCKWLPGCCYVTTIVLWVIVRVLLLYVAAKVLWMVTVVSLCGC